MRGATDRLAYDNYTPVKALGYEQKTVSTSAVTLTVAAGANYCLIEVQDDSVRFRDDGTAPTSSVGMPLASGQSIEYDGQPEDLQFIRSGSADAKLNVLYYAV